MEISQHNSQWKWQSKMQELQVHVAPTPISLISKRANSMTEMNKSGLTPVGRAVLVKPYVPELKKSIIQLPDEVMNRMHTIDQRAIVIEVGPYSWMDEPAPRAKVGDHVLVSKFSGYMATGTLDNQQYRFVNDKDIFAIITGEDN